MTSQELEQKPQEILQRIRGGKGLKLRGFFWVHLRAEVSVECVSLLIGVDVPDLPSIDEQHQNDRQNKGVPREECCREETAQYGNM